MAEFRPAGDRGLSVRLSQSAPIPLDMVFEVAPGELMALVGPSGSGKSTALRAVAGLHRVTSGRVVCAGQCWLDSASGTDVPARQRAVGFVFQSYALFPHLSAQENVEAAMSKIPREERAKRARAILSLVHLQGLEHRRPGELSGGQQQRVAVGRALARDPDVLLLDEPFSAVDRVTRERLQRELAQLRRHLRIPIVLVTHDLDEAARLAERIAVTHRGKTLQVAAPEDVMSRPLSPLVARLMDLRNVFEGRLVGHDRENGCTILDWSGTRLRARLQTDFAPGETVTWCIPADSIVLHRRDRPSRGERENPVHGTVAESLKLGETTHLRVDVSAAPETPLHLSIPTHVARRNAIAPGVAVGASLLAKAIHLMPAERP